MRLSIWIFFGVVGLGLSAPESVTGQGTPFERAEAAMAAGRFEEARALVAEWWRTDEPRADRNTRQHGLWLRARLQVDPSAAVPDYQRLVVEFPGGRFSDQALLRLGQEAAERGDLDAANRHISQLERDYPASPLRTQALAWLSQPPPVSTRTGGSPPPAAASPPPVTPPVSPPSGGAHQGGGTQSAGNFTLQFGAFGQIGTARDLMGRLTQAGSTAGVQLRIVQIEGSPLFRVRGGIFSTRTEADGAAQMLRSRGVSDVFIASDRDREQPAGSPESRP